ncbi:MAG TPA: ribonuclease H [Polyangia bacterium]
MSWIKMSFKGQQVFVHADESGRPILDSEGRAEMKYRESDSRTYRPALGNLGASSGGASERKSNSARASTGAATAKRKAAPKRPAPGPASLATQHVWTDGACTGNPGPMGIGVLVLWDDHQRELSEFLGQGTNNIAELTAIARGLDIAEEAVPARDRPIRVYTDSAYSIGVLSMGWKAKANQELVARLRTRLKDFVDVTFVKVAGHAGVPENERCDELARQAITNRGRAWNS